jgi:transposase
VLTGREVGVNRKWENDLVSFDGAKVRLFVFDDRLEIWSPGRLPPPITLERLGYDQFSRTRLIASLTLAGMGPAMTLDGAVDTRAFVAYVEQVLAPTLRPGPIVLLDNLSAHESERVRRAIAARGAALWFLPAYSPDLSPIEEAFSKLKTLLRCAAAHPRGAGRGHWCRPGGDHRPRCPRLVRPLWLPHHGSTLMNIAVSGLL